VCRRSASRSPQNAATTLLLLGCCRPRCSWASIALARLTGVKIAEDPAVQIPGRAARLRPADDGGPARGRGVRRLPAGFFFVVIMTALILGARRQHRVQRLPGARLDPGQDRYLPRQLHTRGRPAGFSNGILILAAFAIVLVVGFQAEVTRLIPLYTVGVFVSFTLSQTGMVRHWRATWPPRPTRPPRQMRRSQAINGFGCGDDRGRAAHRAGHEVPARCAGSRSPRWLASTR
jgi:hypothetical protein